MWQIELANRAGLVVDDDDDSGRLASRSLSPVGEQERRQCRCVEGDQNNFT